VAGEVVAKCFLSVRENLNVIAVFAKPGNNVFQIDFGEIWLSLWRSEHIEERDSTEPEVTTHHIGMWVGDTCTTEDQL
jgi:hypothetical protein